MGSLLLFVSFFVYNYFPKDINFNLVKKNIDYSPIFKKREFISTFCLLVISNGSIAFFGPIFSVDLIYNYKLSYIYVGLIYVILPLSNILSVPLINLVSKSDRRICFMIGSIFLIIGFFIVGPNSIIPTPNSVWIYIIAIILLGAGTGLITNPTFSEFNYLGWKIYPNQIEQIEEFVYIILKY